MTTCIVCGWRDLEPGRPQVCVPCEIRIGQHLDLLAGASVLLAVVASTEPAAGHVPVKLLPLDLSLPSRTEPTIGLAEDQIGAQPIATVLGLWVEDWTGRSVHSWSAADSALALRSRLADACVGHGAIDEFAKEVRDLVTAARRALGRDLRGVRYATPCPRCGTKTLLRVPGADWIECGPCGRLWDDESYAALTVAALRAAVPIETLLPIPDAAMVLGVRADRLRKAAERKAIHPQPGPWAGKRLFVLGDCAAALRNLKREMVTP